MRTKSKMAIAAVAALALAACSTADRPVTVHLMDTPTAPEHDEVISTKGTIDYYPNANNPVKTVLSGTQGQHIEIVCLSEGCQTTKFTTTGSKIIPDGVYRTTRTSDPDITMVQDIVGEQTLGYLANNPHKPELKYTRTLTEANEYEHEGDTARTVGKIALYSLLGVAVVAVVAAGAVAASQADTVTTTCTSRGDSSTCTTR